MSDPFQVVLISPYSHLSSVGLRLISACLKDAGWSTRLIFLPDPDEWLFSPLPHPQGYSDDILEQVCQLCVGANLVGISVMTNFVGRARALTSSIHDQLSLPVVWGGVHPTFMPQECLQWADYVIVGEGEEATVELVDRLAKGQDTRDIANLWQLGSEGQLIANPVRPLLMDLDSLPLPDYDLSDQYVLHQGRLTPLTPALLSHYFLNEFAGGIRVCAMISTTRGCPYSCSYCCSSGYIDLYPRWRKLRRRSTMHVLAEIDALRALLPDLQAVMFLDNNFLSFPKAELQEFCRMYREKVGLPFFILTSPETITEENLRCLVEAGLQDIEVGVQAANPNARHLYHRQEDDLSIMEAVRCIHHFRQAIPLPHYDVISDNPYESDHDRLQTLRLLYRFPQPSHFMLFSLTFYPGTELYRRACEDGLIQDHETEIYSKNIVRLNPNYYNLVLWCLHRSLPRVVWWPMIQPLSMKIFGSALLNWPIRLLWKAIIYLRNWRTRWSTLRQIQHLDIKVE